MLAAPFNDLLTGPLSSRVVWEQAFRCPCVQPDGGRDRACLVCGGVGRYWADPSVEFQCGVTSLSAKALAAIQQRFGPGLIGDAQVSIPGPAPCYDAVGEGDRFTVLDALDRLEWTLSPGNPVHLPYGATLQAGRIRSQDLASIVEFAPASVTWGTVFSVDTEGRLAASVPAVVVLMAPRRFEVLRDLSQVRAFTPGLPKKVLLKLIDWTTR